MEPRRGPLGGRCPASNAATSASTPSPHLPFAAQAMRASHQPRGGHELLTDRTVPLGCPSQARLSNPKTRILMLAPRTELWLCAGWGAGRCAKRVGGGSDLPRRKTRRLWNREANNLSEDTQLRREGPGTEPRGTAVLLTQRRSLLAGPSIPNAGGGLCDRPGGMHACRGRVICTTAPPAPTAQHTAQPQVRPGRGDEHVCGRGRG